MNRLIREEINKEREISCNLRDLSNTTAGKKGFEIRAEQVKHYQKFIFLKELARAMDKI